MNKKIFILLFFVLVLISMSAVSAADADGNNDTIVSSDNMGGALSIANGVDTIDNLNENDADGDGKALENDAKPVAVGKNKGNDLLSADNDENGNILTAAPKTYYVNASAASGGTGTETAPFQTLNAALNKAENGDTIMIAAGEYKGTDNTGLSIYRNLNFIKYGEGEAIFDAESQRRIWTVMDRSVNIIGLTFKNGKSTSNGGAIYMRGGNVINCTFIDNTASTESTSYGGAIYCLYYTNVTNCNFTGNYARYMGGAFYTMRGGNVSDCIFIGNNVKYWGGAIGLETADNTKGTVTNCAFANNSAEHGKVISSSGVLESVDNNWWGSNDPDWNELINKGGIPSTYAVLNGSADSETIKPGYNAKLNYTFYMNGTANVLSIPSRPIELSATGGHLDDDTGYLVNGEFSTEFSSDALGEFEITATVDNQEVKLTETVAATVWYVNATAAPGGDGKSQATPFQTLKEALIAAEDYDTIMIASGTYTGENNTDLTIDKKLSFEKYGDGEAILDAQQQNGIFTVNAATININGLTFKNGKRTGNTITGGAIYFGNALSDSIINATFIDNTVVGGNNLGGAIYFDNKVDNVKIFGEFINNTADLTQNSYGGAIAFYRDVSNSIINATFIDNSVNWYGGALYFENKVKNVEIYGEFRNNKATRQASLGGAISFRGATSNSVINATFINNTADTGAAIYFRGTSGAPNPIANLDITGKFINNTGKYVIDVYSAGSGNEIHDAVFLNNAANKIINIGSGSVNANVNWFGNNATNYNETPANVGIDLDNWLFLNATANPSELELNKSSTVAFKLYNKNSPDVEYDASKMNIVLDLAQTLGELDKDTALIGEEISYTSKDVGTAGVTGKFETASYTVSLKNVILTNITLENTTFNLKVNDEVSSGATLTPADAGNLTYTSSNESVVIVENGIIKAVGDGTANVTVSFAGDDVYAAAQNKTIRVTVSLNEAVWYYILQDVRRELDGASLLLPFGVYNCSVVNSTGQPLPKGLNVTIKLDDDYTINSTVGDDGIFEVDVNGITPKFYTVTFSSYGYTSAVATVLIVKKPTSIALENETMDLKVNDNVSSGATLNPADAGNLTYTSSNSTVAIVENGEIKARAKGTANITVTFGGNDEYAAAQYRIIEVTVALNDASVTVNNDTLDLVIGDEFTLAAETVPGGLDVTFTSTNSSVVAVDADGKVTAVGGGLANIVVSVGDDKVYAINTTSVSVNVKIPTEIIVQNATIDMRVTDEVDPVVSIMPSGAGELDFTSSDVSVVTVNGIGTITAVGEGVANVTVRFMGNDKYAAAESKNITVTVSLKDASVSVNNSTLDLQIDENFTIVATTVPGDLNVTYIADNSGVYSVDENGVVTALKEGTASIIVQIVGEGVYAENSTVVTVTVRKIPTEITIANATLDVKVLNLTSAGAALNPAEAGNLSYNSSNSSVAMVYGGVIIPVGQGNAIITVSFNGTDKYAAAENKTIIVNVSLNEVSVSVENSTLDLKVGDTYAINATTVPEIAKLLYINYTSSDESVVTVDENGTVTATGEGKAIITVEVGDGKIFAENSTEVFVTVSKVDISDKIVIDGSAVIYGETATVTVGLPDDATGNVTVTINDNPYTAKVNGNVTVVEIPGLASGLYESLNVTYSGDGKYYGASGVATIVVDPASSSVEIMPIENIAYPENNITIKYLVENATTVTISVFDCEFNLIANKTTIANVAEFKDLFTVDGLTVGDYYVFAYNEEDANYIYSYDYSTFAVNKAEVIMETSITENITAGDEGVAIHVVLPEDATGRLMVEIDGESINPMGYVLINGTADINIPPDFITLGRHSYLVGYNGDGNYAAALSYDSFDVAGQTPLIMVDCPVSSFAGDDVNVTVRIEDATGTVELYFNDNLIDVGDLDENSTISFVAEDLPSGSHYFTVVYKGDENFNDDFMNFGITVLKEFPVISVDCPVFAIVGDDVNVTVHVENATGFVKLYFDDNFVDMGILDENGTATIAVEDIVAGDHYFTVEYSGDGKFYYDYMNFGITVSKESPVISVDCPVIAFAGDDVNVTVRIENATGTVELYFNDNLIDVGDLDENSTISFVAEDLPSGSHYFTVVYKGDENFNDDFMNFGITVLKEFPVISVDCPVFAIVGDDVNVTVHVENATGFVKLYFDDNFVDMGILDENGTATIAVEDIVAGDHYFTVEYSGDGKFYYDYMNFAIYVDKKAAEVNIITPVGYNVGDDVNVTVSIPGASGNVTVYVDSIENVVALQDGIAIVPIYDLTIGEYSIVAIYDGDDTYGPAVNASSLFLEMGSSQFVNITIYDDLRITAVLMDQFGDPIANAPITCSIGGANSTVTTLADGSFTVQVVDDEVSEISYAGNEGILPSTFSVTLKGISPAIVRTESRFNITGNSITIKGYAIDKKAGETGMTYATELLDINGNPISNVTIQFAINDKIHSRVTYENGSFEPYVLNMLRAGRYTLAFSFGGNDQYNSTFAVVCIDLDKKPITIKASAKTYKASAKTKKYTVTLSTIPGSSADGKAHLRAGLSVSMKINGKTYTRKTNSKGQVSFDIKITKKGKYTAIISYAGDQTYNSASKSVKITIK